VTGIASEVATDDLTWRAMVAQFDSAHARILELTSLPIGRRPADIGAQLQRAQVQLNDAEQAMLSFAAAQRLARRS